MYMHMYTHNIDEYTCTSEVAPLCIPHYSVTITNVEYIMPIRKLELLLHATYMYITNKTHPLSNYASHKLHLCPDIRVKQV